MDLEALERLGRLKELGVLSEAEFAHQKQLLLDEDQSDPVVKRRIWPWVFLLISGILVIILAAKTGLVSVSSDTSKFSANASDNPEAGSPSPAPVAADSADAEQADPPPATAPSLPSFADYAVPTSDTTAPLQLDPQSKYWIFRTRLKEGYRSGSNFGSNSVLISWGCGSGGCVDGAMIDRTTGIVTDVPFSRAELSELMWDSKRGSNLLLTHWIDRNWDDSNNQTNTHCVFQASVLKDGKFESLPGYPKKALGACPEN